MWSRGRHALIVLLTKELNGAPLLARPLECRVGRHSPMAFAVFALGHGNLQALPREMIEHPLNALDPLADTCDFLDAGKLKANVHLQRVVPVVQDWLPIKRLHPHAMQQSISLSGCHFGIVEDLVERFDHVIFLAISLSNVFSGAIP